ncbi:hypothetical protein [Roseateles paludis]|jgi:hypothetical protein|uniref:Uncharacterized protein n=1 Tax=Roseateles paludis TaxID=3145238 RepID=A0ABV0FVF1_9BURK
MSSFTFWSLSMAIVVLLLFAVNALVYRLRFGTFLRKSARPQRSAALPPSQVVLGLAFTFALLVGLATPQLFPGSQLAQWLSEPYAKAAYYLWSFLGTVLVGVAIAVVSRGKVDGRA